LSSLLGQGEAREVNGWLTMDIVVVVRSTQAGSEDSDGSRVRRRRGRRSGFLSAEQRHYDGSGEREGGESFEEESVSLVEQSWEVKGRKLEDRTRTTVISLGPRKTQAVYDLEVKADIMRVLRQARR
jgi:hypothetical protein